MFNQTLTAVAGIVVGHTTSREHGTGCTAVLCPEGFTPGLAVPGFAPGSRETELMRPESLVDAVHGILLTGGSAFGLGAADGVVRYLRERGHGFVMPHANIPLVPAAVIYDLDGNTAPGVLPDAEMGYAAAAGASADAVGTGAVGAGAGARCGRMFMAGGPERTAPAGVGSWCAAYRGIQVGALAVVNPLGNIHDPDTGKFLTGARDADGRPHGPEEIHNALAGANLPSSNTVLVVVATNVPLNKAQTSRLARMAAAGVPRAIRPAHLVYDGDIVFALASKHPLPSDAGPWTENLLGALGAEAVAKAITTVVTFG